MAGLRAAVWRRPLGRQCRRRSGTLERYRSSGVSADLSVEHEVDENARVPLVPKHRDPHAVLKALSSTLTPLQHPLLVGGLSPADPMAPRTRALQLEYQRAREAGRKSAQYVINRWPTMFPDLHLEPDPWQSTPIDHSVHEEPLKSLVARKQTGRAIKLFRKLQEKGDSVSMETQNGLLELLAYYGIDRHPPRGRGEGEVEGEPEAAGEVEDLEKLGQELGRSGSEEAAAFREDMAVQEVEERSLKDRAHLMQFHKTPSRMWSSDNQAEQFFAEMAEKNGGSYDALILGLVKFRNFERAWDLFDEMRKAGLQASLATYNSLFYVIGNTVMPDPWNKAMSLVQQMNQEPVVRPNITTMNLLLEISSQTDQSSAAKLSIQTFREALHLGLEPSLTTFLALLRAHMKSLDGSVLYDITDYLEENQQILKITDTQDIFFFTVAMTAARNMLDHELASRLRRLCDRDNWILCQNLTLFVSYYLTTITGRVPIETLKEEYSQFVPDVVLPMEWVYGVMFRACEEQESLTFALELWSHMMRYHVTISSVETLSRFCGAMSKKIFPSEVDTVLGALMQAWGKAMEISTAPPSVMIAQVVRLYCMKQDLRKAWEYFLHFEKHDRRPTFQALVSLLKAYSSAQDVEKTEQVLRVILNHKMVLPTSFVRDVCWRAGVSEDVRSELVSQFSRKGEPGSTTDIAPSPTAQDKDTELLVDK